MLLLAILRLVPLSRSTLLKSETSSSRLMRSLPSNPRLLMARLLLTGRLLLCRMLLRKAVLSLRLLTADVDEMACEAKLSEEKAARAMVDAARLADELRSEQDLAMDIEKDKKLLEAQCKDAANRADEAESNALKGGR